MTLHSGAAARLRFTEQQKQSASDVVIHQYRSTWQILMIVNIGHTIVYALCGQDFFLYFILKIGLPSKVIYFTVSL